MRSPTNFISAHAKAKKKQCVSILFFFAKKKQLCFFILFILYATPHSLNRE